MILKVIVNEVSMISNQFLSEKINAEEFRLSTVNQQSSSFFVDQKDRDHLNLCSKILGHIMNHLFVKNENEKFDEDLLIVVEKLLRVFIQICLIIRTKERDLAVRKTETRRNKEFVRLFKDQFRHGNRFDASNDGRKRLFSFSPNDGRS